MALSEKQMVRLCPPSTRASCCLCGLSHSRLLCFPVQISAKLSHTPPPSRSPPTAFAAATFATNLASTALAKATFATTLTYTAIATIFATISTATALTATTLATAVATAFHRRPRHQPLPPSSPPPPSPTWPIRC